MTKKRNKNPWIIGTGSGIFAVLGIRLIDYIVGTKILSSIWNGIIWTIIRARGFIMQKFEVSLLFLIILPIVVIGIIVTVLWIISKFQEDSTNSDHPRIPFLNYCQDVFNGVMYRWEYEKHNSGKYQIENISMYCPNCNCSIVYNKCPACNKYYGNQIKDWAQIDALIRHRIENKNQHGY